MAQTRNTPIKSSDSAMTTKPTSSPPPPAAAATALDLEDNDDIAKDSAAPSSPPSKRRKIDEELEEHRNKIAAANTNNSSALVKSNEDSQSNSSTAAAASINTASAISTASGSSAANMETIDVANMLGLKPGDRIEVKWNINEDDEEEDDLPPIAAAEGERLGLPKTEGEEDEEVVDGSGGDAVETTVPLKSNQDAATTNDNDKMNIGENDANNTNNNSNSSSPAPPGMISVWWKATVQKATGEYHILDDTNEAMDSPIKTLQQPPPPPPTVAAASAASITTSTDKNQTYNCPKCAKQNMSKQGLYTHYGMVHGGKISRDYPNLLSQQQQQQQQEQSSNNSNTSNSTSLPKVRIPIYEIIYDPLPSLGFPEYSHEEVAFISNVTLLNLSSEEMMNFRREGELCSPLVEDVVGIGGGREVVSGVEGGALRNDVGGGGGLTDLFGKEAAAATTTTTASKPPPPQAAAAAASSSSTNPNDIYKEFRTQDDIRSYMNELMQKSLLSTGMNARMASLPRSQQNVIAGRINAALEGLLGKMMEEMGRVPEGGIGLLRRMLLGGVWSRCTLFD